MSGVQSSFTLLVSALLVLAAGMCSLALSAEPENPVTDIAAIDAMIGESDREHWSFRRVVRPAVPAVCDSNWVRTPIDAFVLTRLEKTGWRPNSSAARTDLLRRLFLDVTGLPPTIEEQESFLLDDSPVASVRIVDELLSRPSYGERWGRHWLDVVRYAETNGYERDGAKPSVWRYRDYVINAFNADKPYDRFVIEQFAGDELPDASTETVIATGFHRLGPWDDEPADYDQDRWDQLDDIVRTTSQAFLGITLGCARCHNHKFDPLSAVDYYRMAAVVNTLKRPQTGRTDLDLPAGTIAQRAALMERDLQTGEVQKQIAEVRDSFRSEFLKSNKSALPAEAIAAFVASHEQRTQPQKDLVAKHSPQMEAELLAALPDDNRQRIAELNRQIAALREATPDLPRAYFMTESPEAPPATFLLLRGQASARGPEVTAGVPVVLTPFDKAGGNARQPAGLVKQPSEKSPHGTSQRRLSFSRWMASADNPLTARVIVNRVWQYHFGEGLVRTPSDFGVIGAEPSNPELLDWLADWFVQDANWSLKKLHRLILTSNVYRMSSEDNPAQSADDPHNAKLWRFSSRRLEVEAIRDSMLSVSGQLRRVIGGPGVYLEIPPEVLAGNSDPNVVWPKFDEASSSRRTVYAFVKRTLVVPLLDVLDVCDTTRSTEVRNRTTIAPQALTLFNGDFANRQAAHLADRLLREAGDNRDRQLELAFRWTLNRSPSVTESERMSRFLDNEIEAGQSGGRRLALVQLCRVILNLNEFVYLP